MTADRRLRESVPQKFLRKVRGKTTRANNRRLQRKKLTNTKTLIISYPKSGRTWLRVMLTEYIAQREKRTQASLDLYEATRQSSLFTLTDFNHEQGEHKLMIPQQDLVFDPFKLRNKDIIFLYRDPRDTVVSMYFHLTKREAATQDTFYQGSISDLIRDEYFGLEKIIKFNRTWLDNGHRCNRFLSLEYEAMRKNPAPHLAEVLKFLGDTSPDKHLIAAVCEAASFDNMQRTERDAKYDHESLGARIPGDDDSLKVRRGKVGGFRDYFSEDDHRYADLLMQRYAGAAVVPVG